MLLAAGGCSSAARAEAPHDLEPSSRRSDACVPEAFPARIPALRTFLKEDVLRRDVRDLRASEYARDGVVALTVEFQEDGVNIRRDVIGQTIGAPAADSVQKLVFVNLVRAPPKERPWGTRLNIEVQGDDVRLSASRREYCPPRPRSRTIDAARWDLAVGSRFRQGVRERTVWMRLVIDPSGLVAGGQIVRGDTPRGTLERDLFTYLRQFSFVPGTVDGFPTYGTIEIPVRVRGR